MCCPESERDHLRRWESAPNVEVVHATGADARALYASADVACVYFGHDVYRDFAMPVKLFEAIGRGRPVLANSEDFVGRFVAEHGLGWAVRPAELRDLIANLARQRSEVERRRAAVIAARPQHTWQARCATALEVLMARRGRR